MTREEAIKEIPLSVFSAYELQFEQYANDACEQIEKLINAIYDDFESKQKALVIQVPNEYSNINQNAFNEWMAYKKYKNKGAITKTLNMLNKYDFQTQQEMVDKSIMNEYKGLFEPKQSKQPMQSFKDQERNRTRIVVEAISKGFDPFDPSNYSKEEYIDAQIQS